MVLKTGSRCNFGHRSQFRSHFCYFWTMSPPQKQRYGPRFFFSIFDSLAGQGSKNTKNDCRIGFYTQNYVQNQQLRLEPALNYILFSQEIYQMRMSGFQVQSNSSFSSVQNRLVNGTSSTTLASQLSWHPRPWLYTRHGKFPAFFFIKPKELIRDWRT